MTQEYLKNALRTENNDYAGIRLRVSNEAVIRLLHGAIGLATEAGEALDLLKRHIFYGSPLDAKEISKEVGDGYWYGAIMCSALGVTIEEVQDANIDKLRTRYPDAFTEADAIARVDKCKWPDCDNTRSTGEDYCGAHSVMRHKCHVITCDQLAVHGGRCEAHQDEELNAEIERRLSDNEVERLAQTMEESGGQAFKHDAAGGIVEVPSSVLVRRIMQCEGVDDLKLLQQSLKDS